MGCDTTELRERLLYDLLAVSLRNGIIEGPGASRLLTVMEGFYGLLHETAYRSALGAGSGERGFKQLPHFPVLVGKAGLLEDVSIEGLAGECFVSKATISRFCRDIGLEDFSELRGLLHQTEKTLLSTARACRPKSRVWTFAGA